VPSQETIKSEIDRIRAQEISAMRLEEAARCVVLCCVPPPHQCRLLILIELIALTRNLRHRAEMDRVREGYDRMLQARQEELHKQEQDMQDKLRTKVRVSCGSIRSCLSDQVWPLKELVLSSH